MFRMKYGLAAVAAGLLVAACSGAAPVASPTAPADSPAAATPQAATPTVTEAPTATEAATPTPAAPTEAATPQLGTTPGPITPDQPLEDLFPDEIGGRTLDVRSATGEGVLTLFGETEPEEMNEFLQDLGANIDQMSGAFAFSFGPGATTDEFTGITIFAFRVRGVPANDVMARFAQMIREDAEEAEIGTTTIAGKSVTVVSQADDEENNAYLYPVGDVVFFLGGTPSLVEEAFSKLP